MESLKSIFDAMKRDFEELQERFESFQKELNLQEKEGEDMIKIGDVKPGTTVKIAGLELEVLDTDFQGGVFCLSKKVLFNKAFDEDNCNNWTKSSLRKYLNGDFIDEFELPQEFVDSLIIFERDLTSDDGLKDYGTCKDRVSLISDDEYRRYRYQITNKENEDGWGWWSLTPYSTPVSSHSYYARYVRSAGSRYYCSAYYGNGGVAPAFVLLPSLMVRLVDDEVDE